MRLLRPPRPARVLVSTLSLAAAFALAVAATGVATPASASGSPARASAPRGASTIPPPGHSGTLRITGSLRDGGTVRAAGLSWRPGRLPSEDRLLSFEVGYYWEACTAAGKCAAGAGTGVAPFAARRYVAGHADTSRFL